MSSFTPINKPQRPSSQDESGSMTGQVKVVSNPTVEDSAVARTLAPPRLHTFTYKSSNANTIPTTAAPRTYTPGNIAGALSSVPSQGHHISPYPNSIADTGQIAAAESSVDPQVFHDSTNIGSNTRAGHTAGAGRRSIRGRRARARQTSSRGVDRRPPLVPHPESQQNGLNLTNTAQTMCPQPVQRPSEAGLPYSTNVPQASSAPLNGNTGQFAVPPAQAAGAPIKYAGPPARNFALMSPPFPYAAPIPNMEVLWGRVVETTHAQIQAVRDYHMAVQATMSFTPNPWTNLVAPAADAASCTQGAADTPYVAQAYHDSRRIQWHQEGSLNSHECSSTRYDSRHFVVFQTGQEQAPNSDMVAPAPECLVSSQVRGQGDGDKIRTELATARVDVEDVATQTTHNADSKLQDGIEAARGGKQKEAQDDQISIDKEATECDSQYGVARRKEDVDMSDCESTASQQEEVTQEQGVQEHVARNTRPRKHKLSDEEGVGAASLESLDQKNLKIATARKR